MSERRQTVWTQLAAAGLMLGGLGVAVVVWPTIRDYYSLRAFTPAADMARIIGDMQLTATATAILYRTHPRIDDKVAFNHDCQTRPHELELGCYYRERMYILHIDNASLSPEMTVVAAHELLHAAWSEMSVRERQALVPQLEAAYEQVVDDGLRERMENYARSEPGERSNELHSILGSEYANLPAALQRHYRTYFTNRSALVAKHAAYLQVFQQRRTQLETELTTIRDKKAQLALLNRRMDMLKTAGQVNAYNALVPSQNALVDDINQRIDVYQTAAEEYNALSKSLDSQLITETESLAQ